MAHSNTGYSPNGYNKLTIALHWIGALSIVALFVSHEGEQDSAMMAFHIGGGALLGILILWRVIRRPFRGFPDKPNQPAILNLASTIVLWGLLLSTFVVITTGYLLPWTLGNPLDIYGILSIPSFMGHSPGLHEFIEEVHEVAGHAIVPLVLLHIIGAFKHLLFDRDDVMQRMLRPLRGGK